jgi:hypothetical protein
LTTRCTYVSAFESVGRHHGEVTEERNSVDLAMDLFVYAPLGAALELWERAPDFAKRGRERFESQAPAAKMVGQFAAAAGRSKLDDQFGDVVDRGKSILRDLGLIGDDAQGDGSEAEAEMADHASPDGDAAADDVGEGGAGDSDGFGSEIDPAGNISFPIAGYDDLTAVKIVPMLAELSVAERATIRSHEQQGRGRRTILAKLDQYDAAVPPNS